GAWVVGVSGGGSGGRDCAEPRTRIGQRGPYGVLIDVESEWRWSRVGSRSGGGVRSESGRSQVGVGSDTASTPAAPARWQVRGRPASRSGRCKRAAWTRNRPGATRTLTRTAEALTGRSRHPARSLNRRRENESPFVVMRAAVIDADRRGGALARDPYYTGTATALHQADLARSPGRRGKAAPLRRSRRTAAGCGRSGSRARRALTLNEDLKIAVRNRIFEFFPEIVLVEKNVDRRRQDARSMPALIQADGMDVLLAPKNELGFLLTWCRVLPNGHDDGEQDGHDAQCDEQNRHCIAVLTP